MDTPATNIPEYSVSEISGAVKRTLEGAFGRVRVRGELAEVKRYSSGHVYFCMKDETGTVRGIIWKSARPGLKPEDGMEVIATGRISAWGDKSQYQLIVERLEYAGVGALLARIEALRVRLAAEGLFAAERKQALPLLPRVIGVVTSAQGAVLHDICTTVARRFPRPILLWPVAVQGDAAAEQIAAAIEGLGSLPRDGIACPDVLIVGRGGGSLEDLMAFNDEAVVRAAATCPIPLIAAVGHETDHTLIDLAADRRAPTPTAAAELAVPDRTALLADVALCGARLAQALTQGQRARRLALTHAAERLPDIGSIAGSARQRLDDRGHRLSLALPHLLTGRRAAVGLAQRSLPDAPALLRDAGRRVTEMGARLQLGLPALLAARRAALTEAERHFPDPKQTVAAGRGRLGLAAAGLDAGLRHAVQGRRRDASETLVRLNPAPLRAGLREASARLAGLAAQLESMSPRAVLGRGYALVTDLAGHPVVHAAAARRASRLRIEFNDGAVEVRKLVPSALARQGALSFDSGGDFLKRDE